MTQPHARTAAPQLRLPLPKLLPLLKLKLPTALLLLKLRPLPLKLLPQKLQNKFSLQEKVKVDHQAGFSFYIRMILPLMNFRQAARGCIE